jgi:LEA14-like dessication related protein
MVSGAFCTGSKIHSVTLTLFAIVLTVLLTGCGGTRLIKGESPLVSISSLSLDGDALSTNFDIRNPNGVEMGIKRVEVGVTIQDIAQKPADQPFTLSIDPNSVEHIRVSSNAAPETQALLNQLEKGNIVSLSYELEGRVHTLNEGIERFSHEGHLYPVPGRPGYFRAAGANTPREDQRVDFDDQ